MTVIGVQELSKAYGDFIAVDGLTFNVQPGEVLGLVGPNGAGKTTTMRALTGIISPSRGRMSIAGFDVIAEAIQAKQHVAYVPDDPQLFQDLTVDQHLKFVASLYSVENAQSKVNELLERFELLAKRKTRAADLSRGMRQKLAICSAYLHDPSALLLDEPMTGLDPHGIRVLKQSVVERAEQGAAVVISSHLLAMVEDICTHVLILDQGKRRFLGAMSSVREQACDLAGGTALEDVFFKAIDSQPVASE